MEKLTDPGKEELREWIAAGRCWWCESNRVFKSLSGHWVRAHDLDLQDVKDILQVGKRTSFISEELRVVFSARSKREYDPKKLHGRSGRHVLSAFGIASNRAKLASIPEEVNKAARARGCKTVAEKYTKSNTCTICGVVFRRKKAIHQVTCSTECDRERRQRAWRKGFLETGKVGWARAAVSHPCHVCGTPVLGRRKTCSEDCRHELASGEAKQRTSHLLRIQMLSRKKRENAPQRHCSLEGCDGLHRARGLCGKHYQADKTRRRGRENEGH